MSAALELFFATYFEENDHSMTVWDPNNNMGVRNTEGLRDN